MNVYNLHVKQTKYSKCRIVQKKESLSESEKCLVRLSGDPSKRRSIALRVRKVRKVFGKSSHSVLRSIKGFKGLPSSISDIDTPPSLASLINRNKSVSSTLPTAASNNLNQIAHQTVTGSPSSLATENSSGKLSSTPPRIGLAHKSRKLSTMVRKISWHC